MFISVNFSLPLSLRVCVAFERRFLNGVRKLPKCTLFALFAVFLILAHAHRVFVVLIFKIFACLPQYMPYTSHTHDKNPSQVAQLFSLIWKLFKRNADFIYDNRIDLNDACFVQPTTTHITQPIFAAMTLDFQIYLK